MFNVTNEGNLVASFSLLSEAEGFIREMAAKQPQESLAIENGLGEIILAWHDGRWVEGA